MNTLDLIRETAENARKYYAEAREYFQKEFVNGPSHAIKWHAGYVVAAEYTYDFWAFVKVGGGSGSDIYYAKGDATDVVVEVFVRAKNRKEAKAEVREMLPNARFHR